MSEYNAEEESLDFDGIIAELDVEGYLDLPGTIEGVEFFFDLLNGNGISPDNPDTYKAILTAVTCVANLAADSNVEYVDGIEWITRLSARALRDLKANGG